MNGLVVCLGVVAVALVAVFQPMDPDVRALAGRAVTADDVPASYDAVVTHVRDGDTLSVTVPAWAGTPFAGEGLRIYGIDTPEHVMPPAKCRAEVVLGLAAKAYAETLVKPGDHVRFVFHRVDKYGGRVDADVQLPDGRDWAKLMLAGGYARPYGGGTKSDWCEHKS